MKTRIQLTFQLLIKLIHKIKRKNQLILLLEIYLKTKIYHFYFKLKQIKIVRVMKIILVLNQ